ncbi:MAG: hypothetical protein IJV01_02015 [Bacteroidales bacterium]|nr:hypothetical protein [Bacteroidales bacterium]
MKRFILPILCSLAALSLQARSMDRNLGNPKSLFIEKGSWEVSVSGRYLNLGANGLDGATGVSMLGVLKDVEGKGAYTRICSDASWFFANNACVGARLGYESLLADVDDAALLAVVTLQNKHLDSRYVTGSLFCRNYIPLFDSKILALVGEVRLLGRFGFTKDYEQTPRGKYGNYTGQNSLSLAYCPGLTVFVTNECALEILLPLLSFGYTWGHQVEKGESEREISRFYASTRPDLLGVSAGISVYF